MPEALNELWFALPVRGRDLAVLLAWLAPAALAGALILRGHRAGPLVAALLWRFRWSNLLFSGLIAVSVGLGVALVAQERALRQGTAKAADKFDVILAAPGDQIRMLLAAVYLQPTDAPLLRGDVLARLQADPQVDLAAPIAFGDSFDGAPVVGSTAQFVEHLSGPLAAGRLFAREDEAVAGALASVDVGDSFTPVHGHGPAASAGETHDGVTIRVVGRMAPTGSPWDRAIVVPVENVWTVHGLANGHAPSAGDRLGPPFDPDYFPGTPAFLVRADEIWKNYAIQARYDGEGVMAFFPGSVLGRLLALLGDMREMMSLMAVATQALVAAGVLAGLVALTRLFSRRFALLRALGAPRRFVFAVVWSYAAALIGAGCAMGLAFGWIAAQVVSRIVTARTDVLVAPALGFAEAHLVAAFFSLATLLALLPAFGAYRRGVVEDLRAAA
ncbi:FtsX-like permease family protein [Rubrimonas cliftonensis]|uniref:Putative ABC transport system permease protein n=1 Tax=Rubrimonas cliftonensis TaxID=89524 RepID=A0A1H3X1S9_9RHOB|nr:ABC transporter permease [Rubrimonas cliftonensis]SDZ93347.1 putative ABC transport system permease protein [Rubrimonas cliftonensis]